MKKLSLIILTSGLAACGATPSTTPELLTFVSRDSGITGDYNQGFYNTGRVRSLVASEACASDALSSFTETLADGGLVSFVATCSGANTFEGTAGFTFNDSADRGRVTASVNGELARIDL